MNDPQIRQAFHSTILLEYHQDPNTRIIDEMGLEQGKRRADIAVVNGRLEGFEIKSDSDTLSRLGQQIVSYDAVFDHSSLVLEDGHLDEAVRMIPDRWGIILVTNRTDKLQFKILRDPRQNPVINPYAVAQLLWRAEAQEILYQLGIRGTLLRQKRILLYKSLVEMIDTNSLCSIVREYLKKRQNWRHLEQPLPNDGSCLPDAMS